MKIRAALLLAAAGAAASAGCASSAAHRTQAETTTPRPPNIARVVASAQIAFVKKPIVFYLPPANATSTSQYTVLFRTKSALPASGSGHRLGRLTLDGQPADLVEWAGSVHGQRRCFQAWFYTDELPAGSQLLPFDPAKALTVAWMIQKKVPASYPNLRASQRSATDIDLASLTTRLGCKPVPAYHGD